MQAWVTVCDGTWSGMPAASPASRAMFWFFASWMTVPIRMYSISAGGIPDLVSSPVSASRARSYATRFL